MLHSLAMNYSSNRVSLTINLNPITVGRLTFLFEASKRIEMAGIGVNKLNGRQVNAISIAIEALARS